MGAFLTDLLELLTSFGYIGIALGLMVEIIPSEVVLAYGGYMVTKGTITFWGAVIAGIIGGTIAQWFLYWIGAYGGRPFLQKYGKYLFIREKHLDVSEKWFREYGTGIVFSARFVPVVRHAISIPAGIAKMSFWKFTFLTILAMIPWSMLFIYLGIQLKENWINIEEIATNYTIPFIVFAFVGIVLYFVFKKPAPSQK
ncbi:DedA family protein [Bacillus sp. CBEL-1]|uniref:DedA family protein n=1 Tax=Bacillaceae TaxID=186817 RepID=UPI00104F9B94|nr:DedA family protein [Bacillus sp. CBEL-1]TDB54775.1 DedA family protein [Bacillus sp. CBEL-1]